MFSKYFKKRFWSSFWVFVLLLSLLWLVRNKHIIIPFFENLSGLSWKEENVTNYKSLQNLIPNHNFSDELIIKERYVVSYDQKSLQPRFTIHSLHDTMTRGAASRFDVRINDTEKIYSHTAKWGDYSYSGYDRGHMVPAGDFLCCQSLLEDTFVMSNIAAFDSVLNRYAWRELETYTRRMARKHSNLKVITGSVFQDKKYISSSNRIQVPSHFYKILIREDLINEKPKAVASFLIENKPIFDFSERSHSVSIDHIEALTGLDFFSNFDSNVQRSFESKQLYGRW